VQERYTIAIRHRAESKRHKTKHPTPLRAEQARHKSKTNRAYDTIESRVGYTPHDRKQDEAHHTIASRGIKAEAHEHIYMAYRARFYPHGGFPSS
jgi:hypothetical protein